MNKYYQKNKAELNYKTKLRYSIRTLPFVHDLEGAEFWIMMRKHFKPFAKVLDDCQDIDKITDLLKHFLEHSLTLKEEQIKNIEDQNEVKETT